MKKIPDTPIVINGKDEGEYFIEQTATEYIRFRKKRII